MSVGEVITIVENVLKEHGLGHFENPPKPGIHPQQDAFIHAMPGYLPRQKAAGLKWVSGFSSNADFGIPPVMGLLILNDVQTGQPLAVMDCRDGLSLDYSHANRGRFGRGRQIPGHQKFRNRRHHRRRHPGPI
jgi:hypothetical protein